jgi:hypothetical protein
MFSFFQVSGQRKWYGKAAACAYFAEDGALQKARYLILLYITGSEYGLCTGEAECAAVCWL